MRRPKKIMLIFAAILTAAGIGLFCRALALNHWELSSLVGGKLVTNRVSVGEEFRSIRIEADTEAVFLLPSDDGSCSVTFLEREKETHTASVRDGTLFIAREDEREWYDRISLFPADSPTITVFLPRAEYASLFVGLSTGDVTVPADFAFGEIHLSLRTGDANCRASASGPIRIETSTGDIRLEGLSAGELALTASTGGMVLSSVVCEADAALTLSTGRTTLTDLSCGSLSSVGSTGDVILKNVIASGSIAVTRSTGDVEFERCDAAELCVETDTGSVSGSLRSDKVFIARSGTGRVEVPETTAGGKCKITTDTGSIRITIVP